MRPRPNARDPERLVASPYPGLMTVETPKPAKGAYADTESYVAMRDGLIAELVQCSGRTRVPFPHYTFRLDAKGIPIEGRFPLTSIPDWELIRDNVGKFAECRVAAASN